MQRIGKQINLIVPEEMEARIAEIAKRQGCPKAVVYRNMTQAGLDLYGDFEKVGAIRMVEFLEKTKDVLKTFRERKQLKLFP